MTKVYCKNCEWLKFPIVNDKKKKCVHKDMVEKLDDWYGTEKYGEPSEINKNNDCKLFEHQHYSMNMELSGW